MLLLGGSVTLSAMGRGATCYWLIRICLDRSLRKIVPRAGRDSGYPRDELWDEVEGDKRVPFANWILFSEDYPPNSCACPLTRAGNGIDVSPQSPASLTFAANNSRCGPETLRDACRYYSLSMGNATVPTR
jgi:hypothetical protein